MEKENRRHQALSGAAARTGEKRVRMRIIIYIIEIGRGCKEQQEI